MEVLDIIHQLKFGPFLSISAISQLSVSCKRFQLVIKRLNVFKLINQMMSTIFRIFPKNV